MIVAAGLTPAWQQILVFEALRLGEVNRARQAFWCASGKVLNVGVALAHLGAAARTVTLLGGAPRSAIEREFAEHRAELFAAQTKAATRVCTTVLDRSSGQTTELVENAAAIDAAEMKSFRAIFRQAVADAEVVVLTGSLPAGVAADTFADLLADAPRACRAILDVRGPELLAALVRRPLLAKPNREELATTIGGPIDTESQCVAAARSLCRGGAEWALITHGREPAVLASESQAFRVVPAAVDAVNPIAAGDCLTAAVAWAYSGGRPMPEAIRYGMAAAANNVEALLPARLSRGRMEKLVADVRIEAIE
ncbi:MAG: PfkB family carbohydrate kinase [Pirellulales bacterium]